MLETDGEICKYDMEMVLVTTIKLRLHTRYRGSLITSPILKITDSLCGRHIANPEGNNVS